ncbi:MAG: hypothetical protein M1834_000635 [Cirrosporium novae-zelandiae]|nr:MAG: hypothetical protein M1834_000635 [Cirrosporium novae-zelandiae]
MTLSNPANRNTTPPPNVRKTILRPARPTLLSRRTQSTLKLSKNSKRAEKKHPEEKDNSEEEEELMDSSFLQYCATCEKQIVVPNSSMLYCSESCRKKDSAKPITYPMASPTSTYSPFDPDTTCTTPPRNVVTPRSPTTPVTRIPPQLHDFKQDLDPTEWKPKVVGRTGNSEALQYLSKYHHSTSSLNNAGGVAPQRHLFARSSTTSMAGLVTPPLTTASTASSSLSTSPPYSFAMRPLAPRHNPFSYYAAKSIDLVTPHATAGLTELTAFSVPHALPMNTQAIENGSTQLDDGLSYEKRSAFPFIETAKGSLGQLFNTEGMARIH